MMFSIGKKYYDLGFLGGAGMLSFLPLPGTGPGGGSGPPFAADSADNGLSVDNLTGHIVLGNDSGDTLAQLSSDRHILMNGRAIVLEGETQSAFLTDSTLEVTDIINVQPNDIQISVDPTTARIDMIADSGIGSPPHITLGDRSGSTSVLEQLSFAFRITDGGGINEMLNLDNTNHLYYLGDISGSGNGTKQLINDGLGVHDITNAGSTAAYSVNGNMGVSGTFPSPTSITVEGGIITAIS